MGFQTPQYLVTDYLHWTADGTIQLPDFQRGYKWDDERIRQLLVTILRGHPLGIVMLLKTGNNQVRFKPKPIEGTEVAADVEPKYLLLDGQQRLTSLTQALAGSGIVSTKDARGKLLERRYYLRMDLALLGEDRMDDAVISVPGDGVIRSNFGRDVDLDLSTPQLERENGHFPLRILFHPVAANEWLWELEDTATGKSLSALVVGQAQSYNIPAIELDAATTKSAVATVFEKVNTGGMQLNVFELLTAMFAGDAEYYRATGEDFRLNDDWQEIRHRFAADPVLRAVENTDFLQAVTLLATRKRNLSDTSGRPPAVSAKREDILGLRLNEYLEWRDAVAEAFVWAVTFLADHSIFDSRFLPYRTQLVPLAAIRVALGSDADLYAVRERVAQWYWCGVLGELYGGAIETRFARDLEQVVGWAKSESDSSTPRTVQDAAFQETRLYTLRTRNSAAYKGIYALLIAGGARDWMRNQAFGKAQYSDLKTDIHHVFPYQWCLDNAIDPTLRESIVNKTPLSVYTNRAIGGSAPSKYLAVIESKAGLNPNALTELVSSHLVSAESLRSDDFTAHFNYRREALIALLENAMGKRVQREVPPEAPAELGEEYEEEPDDVEIPDGE